MFLWVGFTQNGIALILPVILIIITSLFFQGYFTTMGRGFVIMHGQDRFSHASWSYLDPGVILEMRR